ncbi:MAG TPA: glycosyltransferase family 4 protein [Candidatus Binatia bacterium]|nr:glycosyltransferase family 4 protein [Candidatus Binatia bacterium]
MTERSIVHVDPERGFSGGETQVLALARRLRDAGHGTLVACHPGGPLAERAASAGLEVAPLACARSHDPAAGFRLRALVRARRPDVVHFHTARAFSLAPFVPRSVARVVTRRMDYPPRGAGAYVRWLYRNADAVIAISGAVRDALVARGVDPAAIAVVPSGVEVERFRPPEGAAVAARAELRIAPERAVIAAVGSLHARKGHAILLRALARLASRRLRPLCLVAGAGPEGQGLLDLARDLGLAERVHWLGRLDDVRPLLWAADVVAMPSLAEGLGVAAIEAMAAGRAVVASAVGGLGELVRDRVDGLLVPPADDIALADALARCLEDGELRDRLGKAAVARAGEYSVAAMARGTEAVYERVRERRAEGAPR